MKICGKVILDKTPGRKDPWVKKQTEHDYFLALKITKIDHIEVNTTADMFSALSKHFPQITINKEDVCRLFSNASLPPGATDAPHITLANFPDFRVGRNVENDIDMAKVHAAIDLEHETVEFDASYNDFELVIANRNSDVKDKVDSNASVVVAPTVGRGRDGILNLKPNATTQGTLQALSQRVFGKDFALWNSLSQPIPYHVTIAQTDQLTQKLASSPEVGVAEQTNQHKPAL